MAAIAVSCCFNPLNRDCEEIHRACKGIGTDEQKLIEVLATKNAQQRKQIRETYCAMYNEDLCKRLENELHGNLEKAIVLSLQEPADRDAMIIRSALERWCTDDRVLMEVICTRSTAEIVKIRKAYLQRYQRYLEDDVTSKTNGPFQKLLLALLKAHRCGCKGIDINRAKCEAGSLYKAGEGTCGCDEDTIISILSETSVVQLRSTFACYKQLYGHDIMKALKRETHGEFEEALRVMIKIMYLPARYFAKVLQRAMKGIVKDESAIARVVVTRADVDMEEIKAVYQRKYGITLEDALETQMCGHFKNFCVTVIARVGNSQQAKLCCN